jgi:uncharacterized membrane protein YphA (DoxX/SURF4 family)
MNMCVCVYVGVCVRACECEFVWVLVCACVYLHVSWNEYVCKYNYKLIIKLNYVVLYMDIISLIVWLHI